MRPACPQHASADSVDLSDAQLAYVKVEPVEERDFPVEKEAVGSIDFNEDMAVQVFTPYPGRIIALYASVGDDVKKGQTLFTIDSPDLLQAESTLIAAAGVLRIHHPQPGAAPRALQDTGDIAARTRPGDLRPADRRRQSAGGARRGAPVRQDRRRDRPHHRRAQRRPDAGRAEPDQRPGHSAQRGAGPVRAAGQCARRRSPSPTSTRCGCWPRSPRRTARHSASARRCASRLPHFPAVCSTAKITTIGASVDANTRRVHGPLRDQRSAARVAVGDVRQFRHPPRRRRCARPASRSTASCAKATAR